MKYFYALLVVAALAACPKKTVEPTDAAPQVEDGGGEDAVVMDALVIEAGGE